MRGLGEESVEGLRYGVVNGAAGEAEEVWLGGTGGRWLERVL